jgi:hypothetical protein
MKSRSMVWPFIITGLLLFNVTGCSRRESQAKSESASQTPSAQPQAPPAQNAPAAANSTGQTAQDSSAQKAQAPPPAATTEPAGTAVPEKPAPQPEVAKAPPPPPPTPKTFTIPAGSKLNVRTLTAMSTKTHKTGDPFQASLSAPLVVRGVVLAPKGADVTGVVANSDPGGRVKGVASLTLQIQGIRSADGQTIGVHTSQLVQKAKSTKKRDAMRTGIAAGAGAAIGAIAGGGKGAAIGAGVGGGAGVATNLATRGAAAELPAESVLAFTLTDSSVITETRPGSLVKKTSGQGVDAGGAPEPAPE